MRGIFADELSVVVGGPLCSQAQLWEVRVVFYKNILDFTLRKENGPKLKKPFLVFKFKINNCLCRYKAQLISQGVNIADKEGLDNATTGGPDATNPRA